MALKEKLDHNFLDKHPLCSKFNRGIEELRNTTNSFLKTRLVGTQFNTESDQINCPSGFLLGFLKYKNPKIQVFICTIIKMQQPEFIKSKLKHRKDKTVNK